MTVIHTINGTLRRLPPWTIYIVGAIYAGWLFWLALSGAWLEPIEVLEHRYGKIAFQLLLVGLAVTPLREHLRLNLMPFRRAIGVTAFFFVLAHFLVWAVLDVQQLSAIWADIVERPYVTIGMTGFLCLTPLAVTSNNLSIRKMGAAAWRRLHKLVYPAAVLGAVHYVWLAKGFQVEPLLYLAATLALLATRMRAAPPRLA